MKRSNIEGSSQIAEIGYDLPTKTMQIKFHSGGIYNYWPVGKKLYDGIMSAESKGKYFHANIRNNSSINYSKADELSV